MNKKIWSGLATVFMGLLFLTGGHVHAATMDFSVKAELPSNQINKSQTYFDLQMEPGQKQTIVVKMTNSTNKPVTVYVEPNTAMTNDNGVVEYSQNNPKFDKSMKYPFSTIAKTDREVTIPANSTIDKPIHLTMPKEEYAGLIAGGIYFQEKDDAEKSSKKDENVQIRNRYAFVIGVSLTENSDYVKPDMKLLKIEPSQVNYRNTLKVNLQNPTATPIKDLKVDGKVFTKRGKDILHETVKKGMTVAPNTNFKYGINWDNKEFKPGTYRLEMTATSGEHVWKWKEYFTIDGATAKRLNNRAVNLEKDYTLWYILGAILVLLLIFLLFFIIWRRRNKKDKEEAIEEAKRQLREEMANENKED